MINEQVVEQAALGWFESVGYETRVGAQISPGADDAMRSSYEMVLLEERLLAALHWSGISFSDKYYNSSYFQKPDIWH